MPLSPRTPGRRRWLCPRSGRPRPSGLSACCRSPGSPGQVSGSLWPKKPGQAIWGWGSPWGPSRRQSWAGGGILVDPTPLHLPQTSTGTDWYLPQAPADTASLRSWERPGTGEGLQQRVEKVQVFPFPLLGRCPAGSASLSR